MQIWLTTKKGTISLNLQWSPFPPLFVIISPSTSWLCSCCCMWIWLIGLSLGELFPDQRKCWKHWTTRRGSQPIRTGTQSAAQTQAGLPHRCTRQSVSSALQEPTLLFWLLSEEKEHRDMVGLGSAGPIILALVTPALLSFLVTGSTCKVLQPAR